jgi:hypothetical protein
MRAILGAAFALYVAALGCSGLRPSPLNGMPRPSHATVRPSDGWTVRDTVVSARALDSLLGAIDMADRWRVPDFTPPVGYLSVAIWVDTTIVGVVGIGPNFVIAWSFGHEGGEQRLRALDEAERKRIESWLGATRAQ